jgi:hypothetical protein
VFNLKVTGLDKVLTETQKATRRFVDAFDAAMFVVAGDILSDLLPQVPRKSGALQDSRFVSRTRPVEAGFGARHATVVHEVGPHKKYLQRPVSQASSSVAARVAALVPRFAEAGTTLATAPSKHPATPKTTASRPARRLR